jgi:hypothetical protein
MPEGKSGNWLEYLLFVLQKLGVSIEIKVKDTT